MEDEDYFLFNDTIKSSLDPNAGDYAISGTNKLGIEAVTAIWLNTPALNFVQNTTFQSGAGFLFTTGNNSFVISPNTGTFTFQNSQAYFDGPKLRLAGAISGNASNDETAKLDIYSYTGTTTVSGAIAEVYTSHVGTQTLTHASVATTFTKAATLLLRSAPSAGANVTITNPYALLIEGGNASLNADNAKLLLGADDASSIYYDGTDMYIKPDEVGTGNLVVTGGDVNILNKIQIGGSAGDTPARELVVKESGAGAVYAQFVNSDTGSTATDGAIFGLGASEDFFIWNYENSYMGFATNGNERARIHADGDISIVGDLVVNAALGTNPAASLDVNGDTRMGDSSTNYVEVESDGDVVFVGGAGLAFAEIYVKDSVATISLDADNADVLVTQFTTNGQSNNCTADAANDKITITVTGKYLVTASVVASIDVGAATTLEISAYLNGAEQTNVHACRDLASAAGNGSISLCGVIDVTTASWDLDLRANVTDTNARDITFRDLNLTVTQIGGT
jgi:hypothetical protein